ncbi:hypothetical protein KIW84_056848 [Lathyrus oleraceus]|uniref:Uncharacterized protein n=1 Tax=Pisum sativum TaxID=3888 RepID=A0A9D4WZE7_PEA|nr:hypothetical protein KIW84_056848 [Pisum sativum]
MTYAHSSLVIHSSFDSCDSSVKSSLALSWTCVHQNQASQSHDLILHLHWPVEGKDARHDKRQRPTGPNQPLSAANSSALLRNHGAAPALHSGQALNSMDNFQPTMLKQPAGSDVQFNIPGRNFQPQPHESPNRTI